MQLLALLSSVIVTAAPLSLLAESALSAPDLVNQGLQLIQQGKLQDAIASFRDRIRT